jgi:hypothetical protein
MSYHPDDHRDCEASFDCLECGRPVCARCEDNPGAPSYCPECEWGGAA